MFRTSYRTTWTLILTLALAGCSASGAGGGSTVRMDDAGMDGGSDAGSVTLMDSGGTGIDADRDSATGDMTDGGPGTCGPDAEVEPPPSGDPEECPPDAAVPGCPCEEVGATRSCRTGRSIECESRGEFGAEWGPCLGDCFSSGTWRLENLNPCLVQDRSGNYYAVSTVVRDGTAECPSDMPDIPPSAPEENWTSNTLNVDCEGQFTLCYTLKAGDPGEPSPDDCVVAQVCTEDWYGERNTTQELPPLESWASDDTACATEFVENGGYGEMSVIGTTLDCETIDDGTGEPHVFNRVQYCPLCCSDGCSDREICDRCMMGGSGSF